jgi:hypothetical protein
MAQKLAHPAQLYSRIAPRQNLHDLIAADGGNVFEALDERREIGAVDMRHGDPHDCGALTPLGVGEHILLVAERAHRTLDPIAQRTADVGRAVQKMRYGADRDLRLDRNVGDGWSFWSFHLPPVVRLPLLRLRIETFQNKQHNSAPEYG